MCPAKSGLLGMTGRMSILMTMCNAQIVCRGLGLQRPEWRSRTRPTPIGPASAPSHRRYGWHRRFENQASQFGGGQVRSLLQLPSKWSLSPCESRPVVSSPGPQWPGRTQSRSPRRSLSRPSPMGRLLPLVRPDRQGHRHPAASRALASLAR